MKPKPKQKPRRSPGASDGGVASGKKSPPPGARPAAQARRGGAPTDTSRQRAPRDPADQDRVSPFALQTFYVDGLAAVAEYVRFRPEAVLEIRAAASHQAQVAALLSKHQVKIPLREREAHKDEATAPVVAQVNLQGVPFDACLSRLKERPSDVILALDHITDPRNLGAIVRSAAFFGVREVLVAERRQVLLTQSAVNTAQGGFALCDLVVVVNLNRALAALKERGYWLIGAAMNGEPYQQLAGVYERSVIVLGAEDSGLSRLTAEACDRLASIPCRGRGLDSLNVAVAAGIMLSEWTRPKDSA